MGSVAVYETEGVVRMTDQEKGIRPYIAKIWGDLHWICGYCNEAIRRIKDTTYSDVKYCPNFCPNCGVKIDKDTNGG